MSASISKKRANCEKLRNPDKTDFSNISGQNNHPEIFSREFSGSGYVYPQGRFHMWAQVDEG